MTATLILIVSPPHLGNGQVENKTSQAGGLYCANQGIGWPDSFVSSYFGVTLTLPLALDLLQSGHS